MTNKIKKIVSIMLSTAILTSTAAFSVNAAGEENAESNVTKSQNYDNDLGFLKATGIFDGFKLARNYDDTITRGEFLKAVIEVLGIGISSGTDNYVADLDPQSEYMKYLQTAINNRLVSGDGNGNYKIDKNITLYEATKILMSALGYDYYFKNGAKYPGDYVNKANEIGIYGKMGKSSDRELVYQDVLRLLCNALEAERYSAQGETQSIMSGKYDIEYMTGIVEENFLTSLRLPITKSEGHLKIGGKNFTDLENKYQDFLGHNVKVYYNTDSDDMLYMCTYKSEEIVISFDDITSASDSRIEYSENGKTKKANLSNSPYILYNDVAYAGLDLSTLMEMQNGEVKLIDYNNDNKYEVVKVEESIARHVSRINLLEFKIVSGNEVLDLSDIGEDNIYVETNEGVGGTFETVLKDDVANVYIDKNRTYAKVVVTKNTVDGSVDSLSTEDNTVVIDGIEYGVVKEFLDKEVISSGYNGVFYLDRYGKIAYAEQADSNVIQYGIVIKYVYDEYEDKATIKLMNQSGKIEEYPVAEKVIYDGKRAPHLSEILAKLKTTGDGGTVRQLVRFKISENELKMIDTTAVGAAGNNINDTLTMSQKYTKSNAPYLRVSTVGLDKVITLGTDAIAINGVGFEIPKGNGSYDDSYYKTISQPRAEGNGYGRTPYVAADELRVYDMENGEFKAYVYFRDCTPSGTPGEGTIGSPAGRRFVVVNKLSQVVDGNGDLVYKLDTYGAEVNNQAGTTTYTTDDPTFVSKCVYDENGIVKDAAGNASIEFLQQGDIIQLVADSDGKIENCVLIYDIARSPQINSKRVESMSGNGYVDVGQIKDIYPLYIRCHFGYNNTTGALLAGEDNIQLMKKPSLFMINPKDDELIHVAWNEVRDMASSDNPHTVVVERYDSTQVYSMYVIEQ